MLKIFLKAPFAVFRTFHTGKFRPTADFLTHSAAYGLLLNLAAVETRHDDGKSPMTLTRDGLPTVKLAVGVLAEDHPRLGSVPRFPSKSTVFQQLHNYPVGISGKEHAPLTKGNKYNITPVRREFLVQLEATIAVETDQKLEERILQGLRGELELARYGLPFLGDNAFLPDKIDVVDQFPSTFWLCRIEHPDDLTPGQRCLSLTQTINRDDSSRTISRLFAPSEDPSPNVPSEAWQCLP